MHAGSRKWGATALADAITARATSRGCKRMMRRARDAEGGSRAIDMAAITSGDVAALARLVGMRGLRGRKDARVVEADS